MRNILVLILCFSALIVAAQPEPSENHPIVLNNQADSMNYFLGINLGYDLKNVPFELDPETILAGFKEALRASPRFDQKTSQNIINQLQMALTQNELASADQEAQKNLKIGAAFLEENGKREGVITTESGLQYEVLVPGKGSIPTDTSTVTVHYEGKLLDGTVFDSSFERGEPMSFPLNRIIQGWIEGMQLMPVGATYEFYIPAELGYKDQNQGPIPANSVLIFRIELLGIK